MAKAKEVKTLEEWRAHRGLTVQAMADAAGLTRGAMGDYIKGRKEPGIRLAYRIANALDVEVTQIKDWQVERSVDTATGGREMVQSGT